MSNQRLTNQGIFFAIMLIITLLVMCNSCAYQLEERPPGDTARVGEKWGRGDNFDDVAFKVTNIYRDSIEIVKLVPDHFADWRKAKEPAFKVHKDLFYSSLVDMPPQLSIPFPGDKYLLKSGKNTYRVCWVRQVYQTANHGRIHVGADYTNGDMWAQTMDLDTFFVNSIPLPDDDNSKIR
jgi:hypothetical protein